MFYSFLILPKHQYSYQPNNILAWKFRIINVVKEGEVFFHKPDEYFIGPAKQNFLPTKNDKKKTVLINNIQS